MQSLLKQWRTPKLGRARPDAFEFSPKTERSILGAASSPLLRENAAAASTSASPSVALKVPLLKPSDDPARKPPNMWSREYIALYAHYACVGFVQAIVGGALVPYCLYVAKGQPNTCATLSTFVNLPFGFKLFYGTISDCVPINGQHRKPYVALGWALTFCGAVLAALDDTLDLATASSLFLFISVAYLLADCAADAALVGFSAREPAATRGSILSTAYAVRFGFSIAGSAALALLYNGPPSGGDFSWGLSLQGLMWLVAAFVGVAMGTTLPTLVEESSYKERLSLRDRLVQFGKLLEQAPVWRIVTALTVCTALSLVTNAAQNNANARWFHISPLQLGATNTFQFLVLSVGMHLYKTHLLNVSWRKTFAAGVVGMQVFNLIYLLTVYTDWAKNGWWVACTSVSVQLAYAFTFCISVLIVPEITIPGFEGLIYGALTSYTNGAQNITNAVNNLLLSVWPSNTDNDALDACALDNAGRTGAACANVQKHMTYLTFLTVAVSLSTLAFLPLLPAQKDEIRALSKLPPSRGAGRAMWALLVALLVVGPAFAVLPVLPQTACLRIAGGSGCGPSIDDAPGYAPALGHDTY